MRKARLARALVLVLAAVLVVGLAFAVVGAVRGGDEPRGAAGAASSAASTRPPSPSLPATNDAENYEGSGGHIGPTSTVVPTRGAGTFTVLDAPGAASTSEGRAVRYSLEVEEGITVDSALFAKTVRDVLLDARGWQAEDSVRFVNVPAAQVRAGAKVDVRITLATPATTDRLCAPLSTNGKVSCSTGERAVLNLLRWETGAAAYGKDVTRYRVYLVNHEVGHAIGHGHTPCPGRGAAAPVMLQQTISLGGCTANTWPTVTKG